MLVVQDQDQIGHRIKGSRPIIPSTSAPTFIHAAPRVEPRGVPSLVPSPDRRATQNSLRQTRRCATGAFESQRADGNPDAAASGASGVSPIQPDAPARGSHSRPRAAYAARCQPTGSRRQHRWTVPCRADASVRQVTSTVRLTAWATPREFVSRPAAGAAVHCRGDTCGRASRPPVKRVGLQRIPRESRRGRARQPFGRTWSSSSSFRRTAIKATARSPSAASVPFTRRREPLP